MLSRIALITLWIVTLEAPATAQYLLVSGYNNDAVLRFDDTTFAPTGALGGLGAVPGAQSVHYGPDGDAYVCAEEMDQVLRFDGVTGAPKGVFVGDDPATPVDESGGLDAPTAAVFGPDGNLYVASFSGDNVLRFDGQTGAFLDEFVGDDPATPINETGGLNGPDAGMVFGPDGHLYVPSFWSDRVLRYDGSTGELIDLFITFGSGGISRPRMLRFHSDGRLYVTSWGNNRVLRFDFDGNPLGTFATQTRPTGLAFRPDTGDVLVTSDNTDVVVEYDVVTAASQGTVIPASGGIDGGTYLEFFPDRELRHDRLAPGLVGVPNQLGVRGAAPNAPLLLLYGSDTEPLFVGACGNAWIGVKDPFVLVVVADGAGEFSASAVLPASLAGATVVTQFIEGAACRTSNLGVTTVQ